MADDPIGREAAEVGVRTFLIADIRGYTRYTGHFGDEAATELTARFGEICGVTVTSHGGHMVETRGDEVLAVFASGRRALRASVELQRALRAPSDGGRPLPLGVGIGLDAGEAIPLEQGYRGAALNLAARLCTIAKPGEILASDGLVRLAGPVEGLRASPRRPVRLKGVQDPVRLVAVEPDTPLPPLPPSPLPPEPRRRSRRLSAAISVLALLVVIALVLLFRLRASDESVAISAQGVGVLDGASGEVLGNVPLEGRPAGVAIGLGAVWLTIPERDTLLKIDPSTRSITDEIQVGGSPAGVTIGDGAVWVVNGEDRTVSRVDPESGREVESISVGTGPLDAAFGGGAVFVTNTTDGTVSKIDPVENRVAATISLGQTPSGITTGFGSGWVTSEATGLLMRFDLDDGAVTESIPVGNGPTGVAVGDGAVWVANTPDRTVSRVDPVTASVRKVNVGGAPSSLAFGPETLWVGNGLTGSVAAIDLSTRAVSSSVTVDSSPTALAASENRIWVLTAPKASAHRGGSLRVLLKSEDEVDVAFDTIDPASAYREASWQFLSMVYDGLVTYRRTAGAGGGTVVPDLALAVPVPSDGGRTYAFRVRKGIRYSNGNPVQLEDFRSSVERLFQSPTQAGAYIVAQSILGSEACFRRPRACDLSQGIEVDEGGGTITFHLATPDPDFLYKLALPFGSVVPSGSPQPDAETTPLPATGPYMIDAYRPRQDVALVRNPHFQEWSSAAQPAGFPDRIVLRLNVEPDRQTTLVAGNRADIMLDAPPSERLEEITTRYPSRAHDYARAQVYYLFLNTTIPPFDSLAARRAVSLAIDRAAMTRLWGHERLSEPTCQVLPPNFPGYSPYCPHTMNPDATGVWKGPALGKAKALVASSGTKGARVTIWGYEGDPAPGGNESFYEESVRAAASLLARLGYRAAVEILPDPGTYYEKIGQAKTRAQIGVWGWTADWPAASNFFSLQLSCASNRPQDPFNLNPSLFCDPAIDRRMNKARRLQLTDPAVANGLWQEVDRMIVDRAVWAPLINASGIDFVSERVGNYQRNPQFGVLLSQLWVE